MLMPNRSLYFLLSFAVLSNTEFRCKIEYGASVPSLRCKNMTNQIIKKNKDSIIQNTKKKKLVTSLSSPKLSRQGCNTYLLNYL